MAPVRRSDRRGSPHAPQLLDRLRQVRCLLELLERLIIIDPPESLEAGEETMEAFRTVTDLPVRAIVYTHNHFDHVAAVKAFTSEEDFQRFFSYFDPLSREPIALTVR